MARPSRTRSTRTARDGLNHFQRNMARGNDLNDEILVEGALLGLTEEYTGLGDVAVASALALRATRDAGGRLTCFSARVDLRSCADGVRDRHDFGAPRGLGGMSFFIRRCGEVLCDNARGHLVTRSTPTASVSRTLTITMR